MNASPAWEFVAAPPRPAPGVASMVGYRALDVPESVHRGMPSSMVTFIVSLDDGVEAAPDRAALPAAQPNPLLLGGLHTTASHVRQRRGQAGVQLAIHPLAARAVFGVPAAELSVTDFAAAPILGRRGIELRERVAEAAGWPEVFAAVSRHIVEAWGLGHRTAVRPEVIHAWRLLERSGGRIAVQSLADAVGVSSRHLGTLFHREVGSSPKTVSMLMRFERASRAIAGAARSRGRADLASIATATGYVDQSHLTREFVRFAGLPPAAWLNEEFRNIQDGGHTLGAELPP